MTKRKLTPEAEKGLQTEARFLKLARSLRSELPWIRGVRKSGPTDDRNGIDFIVYATPSDPGKIVKIPVQVKSSIGGVANFFEAHPKMTLTIPVLAIENYLSDETALAVIRKELAGQRDRGGDFVSLFEKKQPRPRPKNPQIIVNPRESAREKKSYKSTLERAIWAEISAELR